MDALTVIAQSQAFIFQILDDETKSLIKSWQATEKKNESALKKLADTVYTKGGRYEHFKAQPNESQLDKALRLEMVRQIEMEIVATFSETEQGYINKDKKEASLQSDEWKAERTRCNAKKNKYRDRFIKALGAIQYPEGLPKGSDEGTKEGESEGPVAVPTEKTPRQQAIDALNNACRYMRQDADINPELIGYVYQLIGELGGAVEGSEEQA